MKEARDDSAQEEYTFKNQEKNLMGRVGNRGEGDMESASAGKGFDWKYYLTLNPKVKGCGVGRQPMPHPIASSSVRHSRRTAHDEAAPEASKRSAGEDGANPAWFVRLGEYQLITL